MQFQDLVQKFAAAAASGNGEALADLFTADGTYDDYFFGPCSGRKAIKEMLAHFAEGGRNFRWEFFDPVASGTVGYASYRFSFDSLRPEAKGARVTFDGIGPASIWKATTSAATRRCLTGAWRWPSRSSSPSGCARSVSSMRRP